MTAKQPFRLAMRREGGWWVAYFALATMADAVEIGRIAITACERNDDVKAEFMALMQEVITDAMEELTGERPQWPNPPVPSPENERSGHG